MHLRTLPCALLLLAPAMLGVQADPARPVPPVDPAATSGVAKIGEHTFRIGKVEFDTSTREVRIPAKVNMNQGMIEFPVVHVNGRVHEAVFTTEVLPVHFETALRLLHYPASKEVFPTYPGLDPKNPPPPDKWPDPVYAPANPAAHVQVFATWSGAKAPTAPVDIRSMLICPDGPVGGDGMPKSGSTMEKRAPHWVFTGSTETMGEKVPDLGGCIVGIRTEEQCSINTVADDPVHDTEWFAKPDAIPAIDTPVTIIIRPVGHPAPTSPSSPNKP